MSAERCVMCGAIIPEGTQVCINCIAKCEQCAWEHADNCRVCKGQTQSEVLKKIDELLPGILAKESQRIKGVID